MSRKSKYISDTEDSPIDLGSSESEEIVTPSTRRKRTRTTSISPTSANTVNSRTQVPVTSTPDTQVKCSPPLDLSLGTIRRRSAATTTTTTTSSTSTTNIKDDPASSTTTNTSRATDDIFATPSIRRHVSVLNSSNTTTNTTISSNRTGGTGTGTSNGGSNSVFDISTPLAERLKSRARTNNVSLETLDAFTPAKSSSPHSSPAPGAFKSETSLSNTTTGTTTTLSRPKTPRAVRTPSTKAIKDEATGTTSGSTTSISNIIPTNSIPQYEGFLPVFLPQKKNLFTLMEFTQDSIDLTAESGVVGRVLKSTEHGCKFDIQGELYSGKLGHGASQLLVQMTNSTNPSMPARIDITCLEPFVVYLRQESEQEWQTMEGIDDQAFRVQPEHINIWGNASDSEDEEKGKSKKSKASTSKKNSAKSNTGQETSTTATTSKRSTSRKK